MQQVDATLWYRPIQALKFGVQYSFAHADYFQKTDTGNAVSRSHQVSPTRVMSTGWNSSASSTSNLKTV